ncbi:MAG: peptide chain release factor N(5)-glutamine methyltransferase [Ignavibacteriae bacterium]|nr:peptide chain release factor N(5)-glutamine methyltransferase [Ignavibacteriota bacterium]
MPVLVSNYLNETIESILEKSSQSLSAQGIENPRLTSELLLCYALGCERSELINRLYKTPNSHDVTKFESYLERRLAHEPLQYIIGECEFMGLKFIVDSRVLIPRPETEILVERVIELSKKEGIHSQRILDIGTGSGNIAIILAKFTEDCTVDGIDVSEEALTVARLNVERHRVASKVNVLKADILKPNTYFDGCTYGLIVSNPPYISRVEFNMLQPEIRDHEPAIALTDYADGMTFFHIIAKLSKRILLPRGWVFVEIAYDQGDKVPEVFRQHGYVNIETISDYSGIKRIVKAQWL